jgi:V/A-type H+-transporting ATPase subunit I
LSTHVPLLLFTDIGRAESLLLGLTIGLLVMLIEAIGWNGLDNLLVPVGGFFLLLGYRQLDARQLLMLFLIVLALLAAVRVLPGGLFTPFAIAAVVGFPVLLLLEGIVAPIEFFSTLSSVLSYVRIMALGTASVLLAAVANRMAGVFGSAIVGVLFALLFHLVNFALGIFTPTIHALRLHYVEFFRQFYSPGGQSYQPFSHWRPSETHAP